MFVFCSANDVLLAGLFQLWQLVVVLCLLVSVMLALFSSVAACIVGLVLVFVIVLVYIAV